MADHLTACPVSYSLVQTEAMALIGLWLNSSPCFCLFIYSSSVSRFFRHDEG